MRGASTNSDLRGHDSRKGLTWRFEQIRFVLPKSTKPGDGGDGGPWVTCFAEIRFVLPKSAEPRGDSNGGPRVAARLRGGHEFQGIERPDRRLSPRQRAPLVAVEPHQPRGDVAFGGEPFHHDLVAHAADAQDVDLGLGNAQRGGTARLARALPGDPLRQRGGLARKRRVGEHRQAQPMPQRVVRHHGLAGARARTGAARRVGAVGGENFFIGAWSHRALVLTHARIRRNKNDVLVIRFVYWKSMRKTIAQRWVMRRFGRRAGVDDSGVFPSCGGIARDAVAGNSQNHSALARHKTATVVPPLVRHEAAIRPSLTPSLAT